MANLFSPFSADNATITDGTGRPQMGLYQNSEPVSGFYTHLMTQPFPPFYQPYPFYYCRQVPADTHGSWLLQPNFPGLQLPVDPQDQRAVDAYKTKVARNVRKFAREQTLSKSTASPNLTRMESKKPLSFNCAGNSQRIINPDLYTFVTPDNIKVRVVMKKELKNSDVGHLGRIIVPKKDAEENLPFISEREGTQLVIRDVYSNNLWPLKFKYWLNNKTRMYVLEDTGAFVRENGMEVGDFLTFYEDECNNHYFTVKKVERRVSEDDASFALLCEQLDPKDNSPVTLEPDIAAPSSSNNMVIDDYYTGLAPLPEVYNGCNFFR